MNKELCFYWIAIFMLANGALFTWLFGNTPLNIWRQLIWLIGIVLLIKNMKMLFYESAQTWRILNHQGIFVFIIFVLALFTVIINHFNWMRIFYAFWIYFSGVPFLLFPFLMAKERIFPKKFFNVFIALGCFLSVGLLADYLMGGVFTLTFLTAGFKTKADLYEAGRFCFTSEAPTTFTLYYCFCLICVLYRLYRENSQIKKMILLFIALAFFAGAWFTGSRQMIAALVLIFTISMVYYVIFIRDRKLYLWAFSIFMVIIVPIVLTFFYAENSYKERYTVASLHEDKRSRSWAKGLEDTLLSSDMKVLLMGKGVGMSQGQKAEQGEEIGSHYENTFYARISEIGLLGIITLLYPFLFFLARASIHSYPDVLLFSFFLCFVVISYISPNGAHQTTQMVLFLALGLFANKDYYFQ